MDTEQIWRTALGEIELQMQPQEFRTHFRGSRLLTCKADRCVIGVENAFSIEWLTIKCADLVRRSLHTVLGRQVAVEFRAVKARPVAKQPPRAPAPPTRTAQPSSGDRMQESADIRRELAVSFGTGLLPALEQLARRFPQRDVWEMTRNTVRQRPPERSARGYITKVVETAARELGYSPGKAVEFAKGR